MSDAAGGPAFDDSTAAASPQEEPIEAVELHECKYCGEPFWRLTNEQTQKVGPIECGPMPDGNIVVNLTRRTYRVLASDEEKATYRGWLHKSHFATCPYAAQARSRGRPAPRARV